jgi:lysine 6-dehydrogenase
MNNILVLGAGLQGKAALYDLAHNASFGHILAADLNLSETERFAATLPPGKVECFRVDATDPGAVADLFRRVDLVIMLLPNSFSDSLLPLAVEAGVHWVDASYPRDVHREFSEVARQRNVAILPEFGLDPGIDLLLAAQAIADYDEVVRFDSYGAGVPESGAADNPLRYRISWTFSGVLTGYGRPARLLRNGTVLDIPPTEIFDSDNVHTVDVQGLGTLEAYPNGDAIRYVDKISLPRVENAGRYSMRWPGHAAFWSKISKLGLLQESLKTLDGRIINPRRFLQDALEPQLQYEDNQRDVAVVLVDVQGLKDDEVCRDVYQVIDYRDLNSGLLAMQRTVGYTAAIGAQMLLENDILGRGLLSPLTDVPFTRVFDLLGRRGIRVQKASLPAVD